jgi:tetratricopeptide (TPR) repeat protein
MADPGFPDSLLQHARPLRGKVMTNRSSGQIITFYSYKGGTGRTMALANLACLLVRQNPDTGYAPPPRVLAIDWDFEAPGLHRYLQPYLEPGSAKLFFDTPGCLELFQHLGGERSSYNPKDFVGNRQRAKAMCDALDLDRYLLVTRFPGLSVIKAGLFDDAYPRRVSEFDWDDLFHATVGLFAGVADFLRARFDYVLVDSRTGISDTSGICTMLLPDKLVVVFTPNQQSLTGVEDLVRKAVAYRKGSPDGRPLTVFPLPSRVEMARPQLLEIWRNGAGTDSASAALLPAEISGYQPTFERLFAQIYARPEISLGEYFNEVMLQHIPDYAYGEPVPVVLENSESRISLSRSYAAFLDRLTELDVPWGSLKAARLEREIFRRCEVIEGKLSEGAVEEAIKLSYALVAHKPPESQFDRAAKAILDVARAAYPRNRDAASALIKQGARLALGDSGIDPATLGQVLLDAGKLSQEFGDLPMAVELLKSSDKRFSSYFNADHPATLMVMSQLASALYQSGDVADSRLLNEKVLDARRRVLGEEHPDTLSSMNNLAETLRAQGDLAGARSLQEQALEAGRKTLGEEHPNTLDSMHNLAETLHVQGELMQARSLQERVLDARRETLGEEHSDTLSSMNNLAETLRAQGDLAGARALQERVLEARRRTLGEEHPDTLSSMNNLAETLRAQGDLAGARPLQERVLEARRRTLGEEHPKTLASMNNLAETLRAQGDLAGAQNLQKRVLDTRRKTLGEEHPNTIGSMNNLAATLHEQGDLAGALALQEQVLETCRKAQGEEHPNTLSSMNNLAATLQARGDLPRARNLQERVLETYRRTLGEEHPNTLASMNNLAETLRAQGDLNGAHSLHERALEAHRRTLGDEHPNTLTSMSNLAETLRAQGDLNGARQMGERVLHLRTRSLGEGHPSTVESMRSLGETLKRLGDTERALDLFTRALDLQAKGQSRAER